MDGISPEWRDHFERRERHLEGRLRFAQDRIEQLEAALRKIAHGEIDDGGCRRNHPEATSIARRALGLTEQKG